MALLAVGLYPLYAGGDLVLLPWAGVLSSLAAAGLAYHLFLSRRFPYSFRRSGLPLLAVDIAACTYLIHSTGGIDSPLFPLLLILVVVFSFYDRWTVALLAAAGASGLYLLAVLGRGTTLLEAGSRLLTNVFALLGISVLLSLLAEIDRREHARSERIESLYGLSSELVEKVDLRETLDYLLNSTALLVRADLGSIWLLEKGSGKLKLQGSAISDIDARGLTGAEIGEGLINMVVTEKRFLLVNPGDWEKLPDGCRPADPRVRAVLAAPISMGSEMIGVMCFANLSERPFSAQDLQTLTAVSDLAASAIARSELYHMVFSRSEVIVNSMSSGLLVGDAEGNLVMANQAARDLLDMEDVPEHATLREILEGSLTGVEPILEYLDSASASLEDMASASFEAKLPGLPERIISVRVSPIRASYDPAAGWVVIMEDITERVKVDEIRDDLLMLIARRVEEHAALSELGSTLTRDLDLASLLDFLLDKAVELAGAEIGIISLRDEDDLFRVKAVHGLEESVLGLTFRPGERHAGQVAASAEPLRLVETEPCRAGVWGQAVEEPISYLAVPIAWQGVVRGLVELGIPARTRSFGDDDLRLLNLFANQAAIALENINLCRTIAENQRRTEAMLLSINDGVIAVNNEARVILVNPAAERILNLPPMPYINGRHIKEVINNTNLANFFLKSLHSGQELSEEIRLDPPDQRILEVETSLIEAQPEERLGIIAVLRDVTALRELEQAKSDFVSTVSHELRTPLTSIKAYTATLRRRDVNFDEETKQQFLRVIEEETDRLTRLISDLLDVSRIESGRMELKKRRFDMVKLAEIVVEKMRSQSPGHSLRLETLFPEATVEADPDKIEQVLANLLDNAVKYSPQGGEVRVTVEILRNLVKCSVSDQGVGIPEEHLPHIFDKFHRVDNRATREIYGTGLGLYVSKSIVQAHGGSIWVESKPGVGSTFHFTLPLTKSAKPPGKDRFPHEEERINGFGED